MALDNNNINWWAQSPERVVCKHNKTTLEFITLYIIHQRRVLISEGNVTNSIWSKMVVLQLQRFWLRSRSVQSVCPLVLIFTVWTKETLRTWLYIKHESEICCLLLHICQKFVSAHKKEEKDSSRYWPRETKMSLHTSGLFLFCMICLSESLFAKYLVQPRFKYWGKHKHTNEES